MSSELPSAPPSLIHKWFETGALPREIQRIVVFYVAINLLFGFGFHITDTFLTLYLLEKMSWAQVSLVFAIQLATQLLFDYPTGALGDYIGQRAVLLSAYVLKVISLIFLLIANQFWLLAVYGFFAGLGNSQLSGALDSWFDSQYRDHCSECDPDRAIFTKFQAKLYSTYLAVAAVACLVSGLIGSLISRQILFVFEIAIYIIILGVILRFMPKPDKNAIKKLESKEYFHVFSAGLRFASSTPLYIMFFLGFAVFNGFMEGVWTKLILFPYMNAYAVTDFNTGLLRWILLTIDIFMVLALKNVPARAKNPRRAYILSLVGIAFGLLVDALYYLVVPPPTTFTLGPFIGLIFIDFALSIPYRLTFLFFARIIIDYVPNEIRNSIYSLLPTLTLLVNIPSAILGGNLLETIGIPYTIFVVIGICCVGILLQGLGLLKKEQEPVSRAGTLAEEGREQG